MAGITQQLEAATGLPWWVTIVLAVLLLIIIVLIVALCRSHSHNKAGELVIPKAPATGGDPFDGTGKAVDPHSPNGMTPSASDSDETAPLAGNATAALSDGADFEEDFEEVSALAEDSAGKANAADGEAADASAGVSGDDASDAADEAAEVATTSDANVGGDVADAADETAVGNDSKADADADSDAGEAALQTAAAAASEDALGAAAPDAEAAGESATDANASTEGAPAESTDASSDDPSKLRVIDDKAGDAELYKAVGGSHARVTQSAFGIDFGFLEEYEEEYERALAEFRRLRKKNEEELQGESNHEQHEESE